MNSKKNKRAGKRGKRAVHCGAGSTRRPKHLAGQENLRKTREECAANEMALVDAACKGEAGEKSLLTGVSGEQSANRGAPPALPTPIATFTI
jgi:hypothetical protein